MTVNFSKNISHFTRHLIRRNALALQRSALLTTRERLPWEQLQERQAFLLRKSIDAAQRRLSRYSNNPVLPATGVDVFDWVRSHFPVVSKNDLIKGRKTLYPNAGVRRAWWPVGKTSGTSGTPLEVFRSLDSVIWEEAFQLQFWSWAGFTAGVPQAVLRGDQVAGAERRAPPYWIWDRFGKQLFLSTRHLSKDTANSMLDAMREAKTELLRAYPSSGAELARFALERGSSVRLRAVVTSSEPLFSTQREQLEQAFACKVFDFYGMAERVAFAAQCEDGHYHLNPEYSWVEILDEKNDATNDFGYVVGTTLRNHVMPLVRYRLSDRARWVPGNCPCGRTYPRIELSSGKVEDQLFDREGTAVSASVITFAFKGLSNIRKSQVAQIDRGVWEIRIVPEDGYSEQNFMSLIANIKNYVSDRVEVRLKIVNDIPRLPSGKYKWVSQEWASERC